MFSRSSSKTQGLAKEQRARDAQVSSLLELGLSNKLSSDSRSFRSLSSFKKRKPKQPQHPVPARDDWDTYSPTSSFPEKNHSIAAGNIHGSPRRTPSLRSSAASVSSRDTVRAGSNMSGMMSADRSRNRRERTFVGSECSVCEEPLEHTLRGERILQFQCSHVSHEACFYEFIREFESQYCPSCNAPLHLDTSRGGNVLDIGKVQSAALNASQISDGSAHSHTPTPTAGPWDDPVPSSRGPQSSGGQSVTRGSLRESRDRESRDRDSREAPSSERYTANSRHARSDSEATGAASSTGYAETAQSVPSRRHDYDLQAMETTPGSPRTMARNPIPRLLSQYDLNSLLSTMEVPDNKWRPDPEDLGSVAPMPQARIEDAFPQRPPSPARSNKPRFYPYEPPEVLDEMTENLRNRVDNWHGLDFNRFGKLRLYGTLRVGKDKVSWQELECFLFAEMLICVKEKKNMAAPHQWDENGNPRKATRCTLKGSILIKKHLNEVTETGNGKFSLSDKSERRTKLMQAPVDENVLTLSLSVSELPSFHLRFENRNQLKLWQQALLDLNATEASPVRSPDFDTSETDEDDWGRSQRPQRVSSQASSWGGPKSSTTAPTEYTNFAKSPLFPTVHVPIDVVVVVPISSSMQGVKINLVRDALKFMVGNLGERDRMGLVTFGSGGGGVPIVGMTTKAWHGWNNVLASIRPVGQKSHRADVVEGANVAMDLLMQRKYNNPIASIMLISDASTSDADSVDFVVSRAEAAKISIHSFGLGMTHKPDTMIELSTRTKASYTYVKDWMMLRECLAGCLGSMQTLSHQNVKLRLKLPEGSPAKFHKISGALQITKRATGRDAEASLGDLRFGDKRDILVQLVILPDTASQDQLPQDPWETIVSGLEALGGPMDQEDQRTLSVEELPLLQADLVWGDILREGSIIHLPRPSLLAITMLPPTTDQKKSSWQNAPPIPPHPNIVQRRMELLTSDMLTRALTLVSRGQHDRAQTLLNETRTILRGLGKVDCHRSLGPGPNDALTLRNTVGIDANTVSALDAELEASLEWINHPAVFSRDSRKAVLQAIGVISSQRAYTFRTPIESLWAARIGGVKKLTDKSREWRDDAGGEGIVEEP
ncbi:von Willebrand and RING finger domain protein [Apiospora phragmitis]|uniref:von Willebrand and RING finger domain protein n=1 Tax=Apiospora phragmitis TaxID=2905665 RepID=A0ABR1T2T0_9PEZI